MRTTPHLCLLLLCAMTSVAAAQNKNLKGWNTYVEKCAVCHGEEGKGDGPAAKTMLPRPRNFTKTNYKFRTTASGALPMREDLLKVITQGVPGTAMPPFGHLSEDTRRSLVEVIESFSEDFTDPDLQGDRKPVPLPDKPDLDTKRGYQVYLESKCWECHGPVGLGNGPTWADKKDDDQNPIVPANISRWHQLRCGDSIECLFRATQVGLNGTPMPATPMKDDDRWHLSAWLKSIRQSKKDKLDRVVVVKKLKELPTSVDDEKWQKVPQGMFFLVGQVVQKPRLFWPAVTEVFVRAAYDDKEIVLLVEWDDRDQSKGKNLTEFKPEEDPITTVFVPFGNPPHTDHPDQLAIQFPSAKFSGEERPYFLFGDSGHAVNLWWWSSHLTGLDIGGFSERTGAGSKSVIDQPKESQQLKGQAAYPSVDITVDGKTQKLPVGRYKVMFRRALTSTDDQDVQFAVGKFVPIAFNVWQGGQGEIGQRRAVSTWYLLVLEPPVPSSAFVAPVVAGGFVLAILLFIVVRVRRGAQRKPGVDEEEEEEVEPVPPPRSLEPALEPAQRITVIGVVTVAIVTVVGVYLVVVALSALLTHIGEKERVRATQDKDKPVKELKAEQQGELSGYEWVDTKKKTVKLPIERAMEQVVKDAAQGKQSELVPAVGPEDKPTLPPVPGRTEAPKAPGTPGAAPAPGAAPSAPSGTPPAPGPGTTPGPATPQPGANTTSPSGTPTPVPPGGTPKPNP